MSDSKSPPDFPDDIRDLFEDSEDKHAENSGQQSPGLTTHETSCEPGQTNTKRKRSEDETNSTSLNEEDYEDLVCFLVLILSSTPNGEIEYYTKEASSKL